MWTRKSFLEICEPPVIGMVHLGPLPGSPGWQGDLGAVIAAALADADSLVTGGLRSLMVENYHDVPFYPVRVPPVTVAAMTEVVSALHRRHPEVALGVNVLRNDAEAALGIAAVTGARFIRVNVHVGTAVTDQGIIAGTAWRTMRLRRELQAQVGVLADVRVKHARPLVDRPLAEEACDLRARGLADAVIVTGCATGSPADPAEVLEVRRLLSDCPLLVGSGMTAAGVSGFAGVADGFIVGTSLKEISPGGRAVVSSARVREFVAACAKPRPAER